MATTVLASAPPRKLFSGFSKFKNLDFLNRGKKASAAQQAEHDIKERKKKTSVSKIPNLKKMDMMYNIIKPGDKVLDIGAAPGWSKFIAKKTNANKKDADAPVGLVVAIDTNNFRKIEGVHCLPHMDFVKESAQKQITHILGRKKFDVVVSDLGHPTSSAPYFEEKAKIKSLFCMYLFMVKHLKKGGSCVLNVQGVENNVMVRREAKKLFPSVLFPVVEESQKSQGEMYLLGRHFMEEKI